ncbi:MAG: glucokinase [Cyanobacteria bacterium P01_H01_bin.15]
MLFLTGDIGGTNTRLQLVNIGQNREFEIQGQQIYSSQEAPDLVPIVKTFLQDQGNPQPENACFAIAGPVIDNCCQLTNLHWELEGSRLAQELNISQVELINDFSAICYGVLGLSPDKLKTLQAADALPNAPIAVIGAGTGLGQGFLIPQGAHYQVFPTEGGHCDFAPRSQLEFELLTYLRHKYQTDHVSVERVVSGQGIVAMYQFLRDRKFVPESLEVGQQIREWETSATSDIDPGAIISQAGMKQTDRLCEQTMEIFVETYAAEVGNLALKLLPYGGLYIGGGIATKILPLLEAGSFLNVFHQKGRMRSLMEQIPIHIILDSKVGLKGTIFYGLDHAVSTSKG